MCSLEMSCRMKLTSGNIPASNPLIIISKLFHFRFQMLYRSLLLATTLFIREFHAWTLIFTGQIHLTCLTCSRSRVDIVYLDEHWQWLTDFVPIRLAHFQVRLLTLTGLFVLQKWHFFRRRPQDWSFLDDLSVVYTCMYIVYDTCHGHYTQLCPLLLWVWLYFELVPDDRRSTVLIISFTCFSSLKGEDWRREQRLCRC